MIVSCQAWLQALCREGSIGLLVLVNCEETFNRTFQTNSRRCGCKIVPTTLAMHKLTSCLQVWDPHLSKETVSWRKSFKGNTYPKQRESRHKSMISRLWRRWARKTRCELLNCLGRVTGRVTGILASPQERKILWHRLQDNPCQSGTVGYPHTMSAPLWELDTRHDKSRKIPALRLASQNTVHKVST